ncbi:hypothetical protein OAD66_06785 [Bacteroidia bacterium]|nr:hypothetical protein [Bacteroidia bacterium]
MDLFISGNTRVSQTTSWAIGILGEKHPVLIAPYHQLLLAHVQDKKKHTAVRRNIVRIYHTSPIPKEIEGEFYDIALGFVTKMKEAIAVKAFSMRLCERIAIKYPELISELCIVIKASLPNASSGVKNRGTYILNNLKKVHNLR